MRHIVYNMIYVMLLTLFLLIVDACGVITAFHCFSCVPALTMAGILGVAKVFKILGIMCLVFVVVYSVIAIRVLVKCDRD